MTKKEKFKKFCKEHETDIAYFMGVGFTLAGCALAHYLNYRGKHIVEVKNEALWTVLDSAMSIESNINMFNGITEEPIKVSQLGELGKQMLNAGATKDMTFTHFIAIGETTN